MYKSNHTRRFGGNRLFGALLLLLTLVLVSDHVTNALPIEHWIVVMMENRSFDHFLGFLNRLNPEIDGLTGDETNPYNPFDPSSPTAQVNSQSPDVDPNAGHSITDTTQQIFGGANVTDVPVAPMNGFVANAESLSAGWGPQVMSAFNDSSLPVLSTLAMEYALFDKWYSSVPGPTEVNRAYLHSTTSHGLGYNDPVVLAEGLPQKTIYTSMMDAGYSWKIYYELAPSALFMRELRLYPTHFETMWGFFDDCKNGNLPTYSHVEPRYFSIPEYLANDQHPSHEVSQGEQFLKEIYEAVRASPQWNTTALIITYDEHGGYYDHVPTPLSVPSPDGIDSTNPPFDFKRIGIRVPTIVVSPWVEKGVVIHEATGPTPTSQYEHSSFSATMKKLYNLPNYLTKRDEWAATFEDVFSLSSARTDCPTTLPKPIQVLSKPNQENNQLHEFQISLLHMANGLTGGNDDVSFIKTEGDAGIYVQKKMEQFVQNEIKSYL
eukprot:TRINITY_DN5515_c0_g1_i1.p1 TRINITY_DN5515_c0_g1~~TRINITY_DN5515_c0_g1_i1.p1  ORF type:complete len:491 (-),score=88.80 TRINITY_DN5515_c0_g1_i1:21-1493(-)